MEYFFEAGTYLIVPLTTGGLLQRPLDGKEPVDWTVKIDGVTYSHPDYDTTLNDIFRKIDLVLDRTLDASELK